MYQLLIIFFAFWYLQLQAFSYSHLFSQTTKYIIYPFRNVYR